MKNANEGKFRRRAEGYPCENDGNIDSEIIGELMFLAEMAHREEIGRRKKMKKAAIVIGVVLTAAVGAAVVVLAKIGERGSNGKTHD